MIFASYFFCYDVKKRKEKKRKETNLDICFCKISFSPCGVFVSRPRRWAVDLSESICSLRGLRFETPQMAGDLSETRVEWGVKLNAASDLKGTRGLGAKTPLRPELLA
jgi:hypothetical protein